VIDLDAVARNAGRLLAAAGGAELCAVVKADGYGHGAPAVARAALGAGATRLAVAHVDEGVALRQAGIEAPVWVLGEPEPPEFAVARHHRLEPAVYSTRGIDAARAGSGPPLVVHLKLDTGMHRVGAHPGDAVGLARRITAHPGLVLGSVWTHLAVADEPGRPETAWQLARFDRALADLAAAGVEVPLTHAANTAATLAHPAARRDVVRCGIGLYGITPGPQVAGLADLRPALSLRTTVGFVKRVPAGTAVSYGLRAAVTRPSNLATLPIGYADGVRRALWRGGEVLIGGRRRPIVGVVTMDQVVVDCGDDDVRPGDEAVLLGTQGDEAVTAEEWAGLLGTIGYEITCGIGSRVQRRYQPARPSGMPAG
jgi:alanine racemase